MKYKVGDKVRIKSIDWYNKNKNEDGDIYFNNNSFVSDMSEYCGKVATIIKKCDKYYKLDIDKNKGDWYWTDDMLDDMSETKKVKITLPKDCKVNNVNATVEDGCIVVEYSPQKRFIPEDGDIVFAKVDGYEWIFIFKRQDEKSIYGYCSLYLPWGTFFRDSDCDGFSYRSNIEYMRIATKEEQKKLFDVMESKGFKWNAKDKKLEKFRWRAEEGENYYYITDNGVICGIDDGFPLDTYRYDSGNYFKTESEANEYAEKIKKLLKER